MSLSYTVLYEIRQTEERASRSHNKMQDIKSLELSLNNSRRTLREERLWRIINSKPDEPLYRHSNNTTKGHETYLETSSVISDNENIPPSHIVTNNEGLIDHLTNHFDKMNCASLKTNSTNLLRQIQRDLSSPSATSRLRALRAIKSPDSSKYYHFDVEYEEQDIVSNEERISRPSSIQEVMKNVKIYVEIRTAEDNRTAGVKRVISELGATVSDRLLRSTTHVVFKDGLLSTYTKAKQWNIPIVSLLWVEACKRHLTIVDPKEYTISNIDRYENPEFYEKIKRHKSMQPGAEEKVRLIKTPKSKTIEKLNKTVSAEKPKPKNDKKNGKLNAEPTNLIKKLFQKQMDKAKANMSSNNDGTLRNDCHAKTADASGMDITLRANVTAPNLIMDRTENKFVEQCEENKSNEISKTLIRDNNLTINESVPIEESIVNLDWYPEETLNSRKSFNFDVPKTSTYLQNVTPRNKRRQTVYTSQPIDETCLNRSIASSFIASTSQKHIFSPGSFSFNKNLEQKNKTTVYQGTPSPSNFNKFPTPISCTPTEKKGLPNSLLNEYCNTFSATKTPIQNKRRTISNISMDIINQRIENINEKSKLNSSVKKANTSMNKPDYTTILDNILIKSESESEKKTMDGASESDNGDSTRKPIKRKLFQPVSLQSSPLILTPRKTDKTIENTFAAKRVRDTDVPTSLAENNEKRRKTITATTATADSTNSKRKVQSRRSTMLFQSSNRKPKVIAARSAVAAPTNILVFTNMHQTQIDFIKEAVQKLGKFKIEDVVTSRTTHLITLECRRTMNFLRAIIRGVWIVEYNWAVESVNKGEWQSEELFEVTNFSKAVEICRMERQYFGNNYKMNIFSDVGPIYLSSSCKGKELEEIVLLTGGKITKNYKKATFIIGEYIESCGYKKCLLPSWILDSVSNAQISATSDYCIKKN